MPSDRTRRPSASVLMISMVLPPEPVTTSPGLIALPDGMFSVVGTMPMTLIFGLSSAIASMAPTTAAPPPMSDFIFSMFRDGLIEIPPLSNVMPLPTRASVGPPFRPAAYRRTIILAGSSEPPQGSAGGLQGVSKPHHVELLDLSHADQHRPAAGQCVEVMDRRQLHELATEFAILQHLLDGSLQLLIEGHGFLWDLRLTFEDRQDQCVRFRLFSSRLYQSCLHSFSSPPRERLPYSTSRLAR